MNWQGGPQPALRWIVRVQKCQDWAGEAAPQQCGDGWAQLLFSAGLDLKPVSECLSLCLWLGLGVYGMYWDQPPLTWAGSSPCHLHLELLSQICSSWEVQWSWKGDGDLDQGRTWPVTSPCPHPPCWDWGLGNTPTHSAVSGIPFPTVCLSPGPSLLLGNSFSGFLFVLMLGSAEKNLEVSVISKMSLTWGSTKATMNMYYWKYWRSQCPLLFNRCYFSFFEWVCWPWRADNPLVESFFSRVVLWFIAPCKEQNLSPPSHWSTTESPCRGCSGKMGFRVQ